MHSVATRSGARRPPTLATISKQRVPKIHYTLAHNAPPTAEIAANLILPATVHPQSATTKGAERSSTLQRSENPTIYRLMGMEAAEAVAKEAVEEAEAVTAVAEQVDEAEAVEITTKAEMSRLIPHQQRHRLRKTQSSKKKHRNK